MYINPFFAGVLVTIGAEILLLFIAAVIVAVRDTRRRMRRR